MVSNKTNYCPCIPMISFGFGRRHEYRKDHLGPRNGRETNEVSWPFDLASLWPHFTTVHQGAPYSAHVTAPRPIRCRITSISAQATSQPMRVQVTSQSLTLRAHFSHWFNYTCILYGHLNHPPLCLKSDLSERCVPKH